MIDPFVLLTPILMLVVIALVRFVGCNTVFGIEETVLTVDPPQGLMATAGDAEVTLSWFYNNSDVTKFKVRYGETKGGPYPELGPDDVPGTDRSATVKSLVNGIEYHFVVIAVAPRDGTETDSEFSDPISATPGREFVDLMAAGTQLGTLHNATGWFGMVIQVGSSDLTVLELGRLSLPGNTRDHMMRIVDPANNNAVLGSAQVPVGTEGRFSYRPVMPTFPMSATLKAFGTYYIVSEEAMAGDEFHNYPTTTIKTTSVATVKGAVYGDEPPGTPPYTEVGLPGNTFGPVSFRY